MTEPAWKQKTLDSLVFKNKPPRRWQRNIAMRCWQSAKGQKYVTDKERMIHENRYTCAICGFGPDKDIRHLTIDCFYAVDEVSPKFIETERGYSLRFCKGCRSIFLFSYLAAFVDKKGRLADPRLGPDGIIELYQMQTGG